MLDFCKVFLIHGRRTNPITLVVFPSHSQEGSGTVGWLLVLQPCQDLYACYLTHRWGGLLLGLLACSAEPTASPKVLLFLDGSGGLVTQ